MKIVSFLILLAFVLAGCGTSETYSKVGLTQAGLDQDVAACRLYSTNIPQQQTEVNVYRSTTMNNGPYSTTTVGPDPYASAGAAIGDAIANDAREEKVRHLCMQAKGYAFLGYK